MVVTKDVIYFARVGDEDVIDMIPLAEVVGVEDMDGIGPSQESDTVDESMSAELPSMLVNAFQVRTSPEGYNR